MLLRRITKHVKEQNWFAVALDFFIVIAGILIAFQITNWNEERGNDSVEKEYINRLVKDFDDIQIRLESNIDYFDESIEANTFFNGLISTGKIPSADEDEQVKEALRKMFGSRIPGWQSTTYLEMQSAGEINLLDSVDLRTSLRQYSQSTEIAHLGWQVLTDERTMLSRIFDRYATYTPNEDAFDGTSSYRVTSYDFAGMLESDEYRQSLNTLLRIQSNNRQLQILQLARAQHVLTLLRKVKGQ